MDWIEQKEQLKEILKKHTAWLDGGLGGEQANLHGANLRYANLCGADLRDAILYNANLRDADLCDANLLGADLCGANLHNADLHNANLRDANLRDANLSYANLRGAHGNRQEVKSLHALKWDVVWTDRVLAIGYMQYDIDKWLSFSDADIAKMDPEALDFMNENRDLILKLIGRGEKIRGGKRVRYEYFLEER